ncbi:MAG: hypothetical protein AAFV95_17620 [Bacteroidota bacterium]
MKNTFLPKLFLIGLFSLFFGCNKSDDAAQVIPLTIEQGRDRDVFLSSLNLTQGGRIQEEDVHHYCILSFQKSFSDDKADYFKTLSSRTLTAPLIQSLKIEDHVIPPLEDGYFHFTFSSTRDKFVGQNNEVIPMLAPQRLEDVHIEVVQEDNQIQRGTFLPVKDDLNLSFQSNDIVDKQGGQRLTWTADPDNDLPVVIVLSTSVGYGSSPSKYIPTADDGSYTLTAADLADLPSNSTLRVLFIRGNYGLSDNNILIGSVVMLHADESYFLR